MNRLLHSVRLQLTLWYAGVLGLVLALFAVSVYVFVVRTAQTSIDQALQSSGQKTTRAAVQHIHGKQLDVKKVRVPTVPGHEAMATLIMNIQGQHKTVARGQTAYNYPELKFSIHSGRETCSTIQPPRGPAARLAPFRFCTKLIYHRGKPVAGVEVVESLAGLDKALDRLRLALLLGVPLALLLAAGGGWILAGRALEPVDHITRMARSITATDLSRRIGLGRQDELGRLAGTFDEMIDRLERAFREQRRLTADVSHELRSPLTILEAQTTLALRRPRTAGEYRQVLLSMQEEVERMSGMVNQLMTLARADAGEEQVDRRPLALVEVAEPVIEAIQAVADERHVQVALSTRRDVWVDGDAARLHQLLLNLLDNALQYTPAGGRVAVDITRRDRQAILTVRDTGEGIEADDLPHIFQRFFRGDRARQRGSGNSGLGLAIVKWIVDAHGGEIRVRSKPGEGTEFTITLPLAAAVEPPARLAGQLEAVSEAKRHQLA